MWNVQESTPVEQAVEQTTTWFEQIVGQLPSELVDVTVLGLAAWQWIGLGLLVVVALVVSWAVVGVGMALLWRVLGRKEEGIRPEAADALKGPVRLLVAVILFSLFLPALVLPDAASGLVENVALVIGLLTVLWLAFRAIDEGAETLDQRLSSKGPFKLRGLIPIGSTLVKMIVVGLAVVVLLENLGYNVAGILAGLGIGGLAFALAAQKTIENLFGGVSVIADEPVRVGDFCRFGDKIGTVEKIGLRSTRIRTLDRTVVSVPNAEFSTIQIENFGKRDRIRFYAILNLRYETTPDQMRFVLAGIRRLLISHERVDPDPARVRFVGFGAHSLDLEIFAYVTTTDWSEFLAIREDLLLRIMDVVLDAGAGFAFPSQTIYLGRDKLAEPEVVARAEKQIRQWREQGELPFPDYGPERVEEWDDSIQYPPEGSAVRLPEQGA